MAYLSLILSQLLTFYLSTTLSHPMKACHIQSHILTVYPSLSLRHYLKACYIKSHILTVYPFLSLRNHLKIYTALILGHFLMVYLLFILINQFHVHQSLNHSLPVPNSEQSHSLPIPNSK